MSVTSDLLGSTVLIFDIVASFTKLSIRTPNRNIQAGSRAPVIIAISVPVMMSTMSQPSANLNYSHVKECEKTQEKTEEIRIRGKMFAPHTVGHIGFMDVEKA